MAQIAVLYERVKQLEIDLKRQVMSDFEAALSGFLFLFLVLFFYFLYHFFFIRFAGGILKCAQLNDACVVIEVLGSDAR